MHGEKRSPIRGMGILEPDNEIVSPWTKFVTKHVVNQWGTQELVPITRTMPDELFDNEKLKMELVEWKYKFETLEKWVDDLTT